MLNRFIVQIKFGEVNCLPYVVSVKYKSESPDDKMEESDNGIAN